eukprot:2656489-Pyramimonas_sp.AAC.1
MYESRRMRGRRHAKRPFGSRHPPNMERRPEACLRRFPSNGSFVRDGQEVMVGRVSSQNI